MSVINNNLLSRITSSQVANTSSTLNKSSTARAKSVGVNNIPAPAPTHSTARVKSVGVNNIPAPEPTHTPSTVRAKSVGVNNIPAPEPTHTPGLNGNARKKLKNTQKYLKLSRNTQPLSTRSKKRFNATELRAMKSKDYSKVKIIRKHCDLKFENIEGWKTLSTTKDTASGSTVLLFQIPNSEIKYIAKTATFDVNNKFHINCMENECLIYKNVINKLVYNYITPYCITCIDYKICHEKTLFGKEKKVKFTLINETNTISSNTNHLAPFLDKNLTNINFIQFVNLLFQIMYTLQCFNKIGLRHADLHLKNILVFESDQNCLKQNQDKEVYRYFRYNNDEETDYLYLPNIGIELRIYDFDRSLKSKSPYESFNNKYDYKNPNDLDMSPNANAYADMYRVIESLATKIYISYVDTKPKKYEKPDDELIKKSDELIKMMFILSEAYIVYNKIVEITFDDFKKHFDNLITNFNNYIEFVKTHIFRSVSEIIVFVKLSLLCKCSYHNDLDEVLKKFKSQEESGEKIGYFLPRPPSNIKVLSELIYGDQYFILNIRGKMYVPDKEMCTPEDYVRFTLGPLIKLYIPLKDSDSYNIVDGFDYTNIEKNISDRPVETAKNTGTSNA